MERKQKMKNFYIPLLTVTVIAGGLMFQLASAHSPFWQTEGNGNRDYGLQMGMGQIRPMLQKQGMTKQQMYKQMQTNHQKKFQQFQQMVKEGSITREQANERIEMMQEHHKQFQDGHFQHQHRHK